MANQQQKNRRHGRELENQTRELYASLDDRIELEDITVAGSAPGVDLKFSPLAKRIFGDIAVECKFRSPASINLYDLWDDATKHGKDYSHLVIRSPRKKALHVIDEALFSELMKAWIAQRERPIFAPCPPPSFDPRHPPRIIPWAKDTGEA